MIATLKPDAPAAPPKLARLHRYGHRILEMGKKVSSVVADSPALLKMAAQLGLPDVLLFFGVAPGDDLLCTMIVRELKKRGRSGIWMMSNFPDLFEGSADVERVVPVDYRYQRLAKTWRREYHELEYAFHDKEADQSVPPTRHILAELCYRIGIRGPIDVRPYLHLTEEEITKGAWARGAIAIQSSGLAARWPMQNKQWYPDRFQEVADALGRDHPIIQVGAPGDPEISGAIDLRGKTGRRETAAVLANARLFVGNVGFLMHLARAVECPGVIIFGGREAPWQSGYSCNTNLYEAVPCAPCWLWNRCDFDRVCMQNISSSQAIEAAREQLLRRGEPLAVETLTL